MQRILRDNGLSLGVCAVFLVLLVGQSVAGVGNHRDEQRQHGEAPIGYVEYLRSGTFLESVFENWESEFFQMGFYVLLTVWLRQRGSSESKDPDEPSGVDADPRLHRNARDAPGPVRRGGWMLALYEHSLTLAFLALFAGSFALHLVSGVRAWNEERASHGEPMATLGQYATSSRFWFESLQNWQSEFLAVLSIVVLSIFLRERGSPESKPVAAPHKSTGTG